MRYIIAPLDLTTEEFEIYRLIYKKMDFETYLSKYTLSQLVRDSNSLLNLTKPKVNRIIKKFISNNLLTEIKKGNRGNPTIYKITKIDDLMKLKQNIIETQTKLKQNVSETNKLSNINDLDDTEKLKQNVIETQTKLKQNVNSTPINDKEKEKEKEKEIIYTQEKEIFDYWNSKAGVIHSQEKSFNKNKISTAIKNLGKDKILIAIDRLDKAVLDSAYYYNFKWNLFKWLKQANGVSNWLDDGQFWNDYNNKEESNGRIKQNNKSSENESGINWKEYTRKQDRQLQNIDISNINF